MRVLAQPWYAGAGLPAFLTRFALAAGCLLACGLVAAAEKAEELSELRTRIERLQQELADTEESRSEAADALKQSERAISDASRRLREISTRQEEIDRQLAELRERGARVEGDMAAGGELLGRMLRQRYLQGGHSFLKLLVKGQDPNRISRQLHYLTYVSTAQATLLQELSVDQQRIAAITEEIRAKSEETAALRAEEQEQKARVEAERRERRRVLASLSKQLSAQRREIGKLKRDEERLSRLVEKLAKALAEPPKGTGIRNEAVPDPGQGGAPFQQLKGRLHLPVRGELANRYGSPRSDSGVIWRGLLIMAEAGAPVKAIAEGRVVYADWLRGFGNLLILDHGSGYMSLYGYNETLLRRVGDRVRPGDTIASVGNSGGGSDPALYFELRHQGKPFDPLPWAPLK